MSLCPHNQPLGYCNECSATAQLPEATAPPYPQLASSAICREDLEAALHHVNQASEELFYRSDAVPLMVLRARDALREAIEAERRAERWKAGDQ